MLQNLARFWYIFWTCGSTVNHLTELFYNPVFIARLCTIRYIYGTLLTRTRKNQTSELPLTAERVNRDSLSLNLYRNGFFFFLFLHFPILVLDLYIVFKAVSCRFSKISQVIRISRPCADEKSIYNKSSVHYKIKCVKN